MPKLFVIIAIAAAMGAGPAAAQDVAALGQACSADLQRLCAGIQPGGGRILQCIRAHKAELSPDCQSALTQAAAQLKAKTAASASTSSGQ